MSIDKRIGFTTTIPVEVLLAAGLVPIDLNNLFINDEERQNLVCQAERAGFTTITCGWIKGLYSTVLKHNIRTVVAVTQGDCSNTHALMETLMEQGVHIIPFAFPWDHDPVVLTAQLKSFRGRFQVRPAQLRKTKQQCDKVRRIVHRIDRLTWHDNKVTGKENHLWQVQCSDFNGDPHQFAHSAKQFLKQARQRKPLIEDIRLAFVGVPPIFDDIYEYIEECGARVVFNEIQRQFSMPFRTRDLVTQYTRYTYPYDVYGRIRDIKREIRRREIDGMIHYVQAFCFRQIQDIVMRKRLKGLPILTIEGDNPGPLDTKSKLRIEAFIETVRRMKRA